MNLIVELFLRGLIVNFLGERTRFYFFKIFGKEKSLDYLSGTKKKQGDYSRFEQHIINVIVGLTTFCIIFFLLAYMMFHLDIL